MIWLKPHCKSSQPHCSMPLCGFYAFPNRVGCNFAFLENETDCLASSTLYLVLFLRQINSSIAVVFTAGWHSLMCIYAIYISTAVQMDNYCFKQKCHFPPLWFWKHHPISVWCLPRGGVAEWQSVRRMSSSHWLSPFVFASAVQGNSLDPHLKLCQNEQKESKATKQSKKDLSLSWICL